MLLPVQALQWEVRLYSSSYMESHIVTEAVEFIVVVTTLKVSFYEVDLWEALLQSIEEGRINNQFILLSHALMYTLLQLFYRHRRWRVLQFNRSIEGF